MPDGSADAFRPLTVFVEACAGGAARALVHNDRLEPAQARLTWEVMSGSRTVASGTQDLRLQPGEVIAVPTPWTGLGGVRVRATLTQNGTIVATDEQTFDDPLAGGRR